MKSSRILDERRERVSLEAKRNVEMSFKIVDRIHDILEYKGLKQKDLALLLNKREGEINQWMRGTHNFTIDTLCAIEDVLGAPIIEIINQPIGVLQS